MWDLTRARYKDAYLNVRFIESIEALLDMSDAGILGPAPSTVTSTMLAAAKAAFAATFG